MSPDVKDLDDYLTPGNSHSNNVSDIRHNNDNNNSNSISSDKFINNNPSCSINLGDDTRKHDRNVRNSSPVSDNSQNISIVSLDDNDIDSSIASDSDFDDDFHKDAKYIIENLSNGQTKPDSNNDGVIIVSQKLHDEATAAARPQISSVAVQNSSDITFGNKIFYKGPVTIKQFLLDNNKWRPSNGANDNPMFQNSNGNINSHAQGSNDLGEKKDSTTAKPKEPLTLKYILKKYRKYIVINAIGLLVILFVIIGLVIWLKASPTTQNGNSGDGDQNRKFVKNPNIEQSLPTKVSKLRIVSRDEWIAQPPNAVLKDLHLPVGRVIIAHTATEGCTTQAQCVYRVRMIQTYHMESKSWDDIGYNFLVGGDGAVYEGRGWDKQGAHTLGYNEGSIGIALIGTFTKTAPQSRQFDALKLIIEDGVRLGKLTQDYKIYPHRAFSGTESPGDRVIEVIKTWSHYIDHLLS